MPGTRFQHGLLAGTGIVGVSLGAALALYLGGNAHIVGDMFATGNIGAGGSLSGATLDIAGTMTGTKLEVMPASGSGQIRVSGAGGTGTGGTICSEDVDGAGYTVCTTLNGTQSCRIAQADECL